MKKILFVVEDTEVAQFRYRVGNVIESLKKSKKWQARYVLTSDFGEKDLDGVDLMVVLRQSGKNGKILKIVNDARGKGIKVLFDLDDLIFDYLDLPVLMKSTNSKNVLYWLGYFWGIRRIAKRVNGFVTTNDFLKEKLERSFSKPVAVIPNSLNDEQVEISKKYIKEKEKQSDKFTIGYFSGSPTHTNDFRMVEPDLIRFLTERPNAFLKVVGYMEFSDRMKKMIDDGRVEVLELTDYLELEKMISEVNVNIAPLMINDFTNCKSELKFFEAAIVETTTIASPTYIFKKVIIDGENGFLAQSGEWYKKLEYLYNNPDASKKVAKNARKYALENYYGEKFLKEVERAYDFFE